ncbi:MAG TPA: capsule assembly Wzi family protein [Pseudosphingobacterium sp.]|nr:capsule assembly Wzi family protein [Pseudosphingobacterium sp.]
MNNILKKLVVLSACTWITSIGYAQVLPVGTPVLEDYYRRLQLLGKIDSTISFSIRPLSNAALKQNDIYNPLQENSSSINRINFGKGAGSLQLLPIEWKGQVVSTVPYGWNDGPMIPARGFQTYISTGIFAQYKFLSIQFRPEFVSAQNSNFDTFYGRNENDWRIWWQEFANKIDVPERFGSGAYTKVFLGQSSIRFNFDPISFGVSTESLWWGPGRRNSLLMSNTAPGFLHATINTTRPIRTGIGSFEGQLVGGKLEASGYPPRILANDDYHEKYYNPKVDDWRYFSGLVLSYQPKWVPGLTVGFVNVFTVNGRDRGNKLGDYIPFFSSGAQTDEVDLSNPAYLSDRGAQDRNFSIFGRWVVPSVQFEIYGEYARNDRSWDLRDLTVGPNHSRSYLIGVNKLVPLQNTTNDLLQISAEVTQLEPARVIDIRSTGPMYQHHIVRDGYTHLGQVLGAGVGVGNNIQSLEINWLRGMSQLGVQIERLVHNNDFLYRAVQDMRANWVDFGIGFNGQYAYKRFLFSGNLKLVRALNYQYRVEDRVQSGDFWKFNRQDKTNCYLQVGTFYRF